MRTFRVTVEQIIEVQLDETKFSDEFMKEFRSQFFNFDTLEEHAEHIGQLQAREIIDLSVMPEFIEGYGPSQDMGIKAQVVRFEAYAEPKEDAE